MAARKKAAKRKPAKKAARKAASRRPSAKKSAKKAAPPKRRFPETLRVRRVSAGLTVNDLQKSLAWYRDVAGFHVGEMWKGPDGTVRGAEIMAGAARFFLGQDDWAKGRDRKKGVGFSLWCETEQDIDALAARIKGAGGRLALEPKDEPGLGRNLAVDDPDGFRLRIYRRG